MSAIMTSLKTRLDDSVTAGKLSATTESTILARLNDKVTAIVNGRWHWWWPVRHHLGFHVRARPGRARPQRTPSSGAVAAGGS